MRTQLGVVKLDNRTGKYSVTFETFKGTPGSEYVAFEVESAAVFDTEEEAYEGGNRALKTLAETAAYPNLCKKF